MSSWFSSTAHLHHRTALPPTASRATILSVLRNHDTLIRLDAELDSYEEVAAPANSKSKSPTTPTFKTTPETVQKTNDGGVTNGEVKKEVEGGGDGDGEEESTTKHYVVTDKMHALPAGLWDSTVKFAASITDIPDGVEWRIKAPMGLVQKVFWTVQPCTAEEGRKEGLAKEGGKAQEEAEPQWAIDEDVTLQGQMLIVGYVKRKCEDIWHGVHGRFVEAVEKEMERRGER